MDAAACRGVDTEIFFPSKGGTSVAIVAAAKAVCRDCPVRRRCLDYALEMHEQHGIWGGFTTDERRALARKRRRTAA